MVAIADCGHGHQVGTGEVVETVIGNERGAHGGANGRVRGGAAYLEVEVRYAVGRAVDAEYLADDAELEDGDAIEDERRHRPDHGSILT